MDAIRSDTQGTNDFSINAGSGAITLPVIGDNNLEIKNLTITTTGTVTFGSNVSTNGDISISSGATVFTLADVTISSSLGNGDINLSGANIDDTTSNVTINAGSEGGDISLGSVNVASLNATTGSTGTFTFNNDVTVNTGDIDLIGNGDVIVSNSVTVDTTGNDVDLNDSNIFADAGGFSLTIDTDDTNDGTITIAAVDDNAGDNPTSP